MIILAFKPGQLGNMLFLFSGLIANSMHHTYKLVNPAFEEYAKYFSSTNDNIFCSYPSQKTWITTSWLRKFLYYVFYYLARLVNKIPFQIPFFETIHLDCDQSVNMNSPDFIHKAKNKILLLQGWLFRDHENFKRYSEEIKTIFTPQSQYLENIKIIILRAKNRGSLLVGIHIRRGDYKIFEGGKYFYSIEDYKEVMKKTSRLFPYKQIIFLVCSNETLNAADFDNFNYIFGTGKEIEDLYSFSQCDYIIGPPSTYTMWASFYGKVPLYTIENSNHIIQLSNFEVKYN